MRSLLVLSALFALTHDVYSARILGLFPHPGKSHQMVFDPFLRTLAERGHHVTVVSFYPNKNPPANYTDVSLVGLANLGLEIMDLRVLENPNKLLRLMGLDKMVKQIRDFDPLGELAVDVCSKMVKLQPLADALKKEYDLVIMENFNSDCMMGLAHVYGQRGPFLYLSSSALLQWTPGRFGLSDNPSYVPIVTSDFANPMSFLQRLENTFLNIYYKIWYRYAVQLKEQEIIEEHFGKQIPDLQELSMNVSAVLVNVYHSLAGVKPLLPGVIEVGGMHLDHSKKTIPNYIESFLNESEHGVVLLSFGSMIKTASMPKYKEDMIINALSKIKQRVIWKFEKSDEEGTVIGNILKVRWLPQYQLLQHPKVVAFIGHGGLLGMTEAISAGKPMLVVPFFADQPYNGAAASAAGFAKVLLYTDLTEKTLVESLQSVLSPEMRISALRASKIWKDRQADPLETAVYWTERVIRWGHHAPLHSHARDLPLYQYLLLDVAATFIVGIIVLALILRRVLVLILRFVSGDVYAKEKLN